MASGSPQPDNLSAADGLPNPPASEAAAYKDVPQTGFRTGQTLRAQNNWRRATTKSTTPPPGSRCQAEPSAVLVPSWESKADGKSLQTAVPPDTNPHK